MHRRMYNPAAIHTFYCMVQQETPIDVSDQERDQQGWPLNYGSYYGSYYLF